MLNDPTFHQLSALEQARIVGEADGCPLITELTDPDNTEPGRGPEAMLRRYGSANFWFTYITRASEDVNPALYDQLMSSVERLPEEPVGRYEPESVPESHLSRMASMGTLAGYSLPRIFIKQLGEGLPQEETLDRLAKGLDVVKRAIPQANTPTQLLVLVAEGLVKDADVSTLAALNAVLSPGWLSEHNSTSIIDNARQTLKTDAPRLWGVYAGLSVEEKVQNKIL